MPAAAYIVVDKISYLRARAWPNGCIGRVRARAKVSCIQLTWLICQHIVLSGYDATCPLDAEMDLTISYKYDCPNQRPILRARAPSFLSKN